MEEYKSARHKSAVKRAQQNEKRRIRNRMVKTRVKNIIKEVRHSVSEKSGDAMQKLHQAQSIIDTAAKKGVLKKQTASRKVSRLTQLVNA